MVAQPCGQVAHAASADNHWSLQPLVSPGCVCGFPFSTVSGDFGSYFIGTATVELVRIVLAALSFYVGFSSAYTSRGSGPTTFFLMLMTYAHGWFIGWFVSLIIRPGKAGLLGALLGVALSTFFSGVRLRGPNIWSFPFGLLPYWKKCLRLLVVVPPLNGGSGMLAVRYRFVVTPLP